MLAIYALKKPLFADFFSKFPFYDYFFNVLRTVKMAKKEIDAQIAKFFKVIQGPKFIK